MPKKHYQPGGADQKRPAPLPTQRGPVKHGGLRGLVDFNDNPHPLPPAARKRNPNRGAQ